MVLRLVMTRIGMCVRALVYSCVCVWAFACVCVCVPSVSQFPKARGGVSFAWPVFSYPTVSREAVTLAFPLHPSQSQPLEP